MKSCLQALRILASALALYLKSNAQRTISISSITGQKKVKIAFRALAKFHDSSLGYSLFSEALASLLLKDTSWLKNVSWEVGLIENEAYLTIPLDFIKKFLNASEEEILKYLLDSGACRKAKH